jgi:hypothetical protein
VFGHGSPRVGGADADLIAGSALIDVKVVKENVQAADLNQLFGYWLLAREQRRCDQAFPAITHVGVYLARHGLCWTAPVDPILNAPGFGAVEEWFRAHAARVYPRREAVPLPPDWPDDLRPPPGSADPEAWARFAAAAEARPHLGPRWGWPGPEMIRAIPEALARLAATGDVARMRLCPESLRFERGLAGGPPVVTLSIGRPLAPGSVLAPGQFDRLGWVKPSARPGQLPDRPERSATPADFPGLIDHYPQAAWDFFLRLAKPAPAGDNGGRR